MSPDRRKVRTADEPRLPTGTWSAHEKGAVLLAGDAIAPMFKSGRRRTLRGEPTILSRFIEIATPEAALAFADDWGLLGPGNLLHRECDDWRWTKRLPKPVRDRREENSHDPSYWPEPVGMWLLLARGARGAVDAMRGQADAGSRAAMLALLTHWRLHEGGRLYVNGRFSDDGTPLDHASDLDLAEAMVNRWVYEARVVPRLALTVGGANEPTVQLWPVDDLGCGGALAIALINAALESRGTPCGNCKRRFHRTPTHRKYCPTCAPTPEDAARVRWRLSKARKGGGVL